MTDLPTNWRHYNGSKWPAQCCFCQASILTTQGRWSAKMPDGRAYYACHECIKPPEAAPMDQPPPKPGATPTIQPNLAASAQQTRESQTAQLHAENMASEKATRDALALLAVAISDLTAEYRKRNELLAREVSK